MTTIIHWFRRDLRLDDNTALIAAAERATTVIPLFILDESLLNTPRGGGGPRVGFMVDSLHALNTELHKHHSRLFIRRGEPLAVLRALIAESGAQAVFYNCDYSPYARQRDKTVVDALRAEGINVQTFKDQVLVEFNQVLTKDDAPYQVFTPYLRRWMEVPKDAPQDLARLPTPPDDLPGGDLPSLDDLGGTRAAQPITQAGEAAAQAALQDFMTNKVQHYATGRDLLAEDGTSRLSPHFRWGSLSIRRAHAMVDRRSEGARVWESELAWRDFYQMILAYFPRVLRHNYRPKYDALQWENNKEYFAAWCEGRTGYPVVDAAMRQLNITGWMHNRARMIVASFMCKDLLIDWQWGERYFMQQLIDGDTAANNGGWQWAAGTGTDAAPYFRIFNPTSQGEKYDPQGDYVRRWVPELAGIPGKKIHQPRKAKGEFDYPAPLVDHKQQRERALAMYAVTKES
ncbi:MAG: cryptochrome/photolyase family protein [Anaerolineales bacterium]